MRKLVIWFLVLFVLFIVITKQTNVASSTNDQPYQVIPDEAIRLRILANSDSEADQAVKNLIRDRVNEHITEWVADLTTIDDARQLIQARLSNINQIAEQVLKEENNDHTVTVEYGENITFPLKMYDSYIYPPGEYEAVLITIGEGKGTNWWCVLFPPLCFLDFSNGSTVADNADDQDLHEDDSEDENKVSIRFFLFEWLGWT